MGQAQAADAALAAAETERQAADAAVQGAREDEAVAALPLKDAEAHLRQLEVERDTLARLVATAGAGQPLLDTLQVERGVEQALGAALSDALDQSLDRWRDLPPLAQALPLPEGATPLAAHVKGPPALARRLSHIGLVPQGEGARLQNALHPGQCLVSREGDLWRWDGFTIPSAAPARAALRLAEKNRLADLEVQVVEARGTAALHRDGALVARQALSAAQERQKRATREAQAARQQADAMRTRRAAADRALAEQAARRAGLEATLKRMHADLADAERRGGEVARDRQHLPDAGSVELDAARTRAEEARTLAADLNAARQSIARERSQRQARRDGIARERKAWLTRRSDADVHLEGLIARRQEYEAERTTLVGFPDEAEARRGALFNTLQAAEAAARAAAEHLDVAEAGRLEAERAARAALADLSEAREHLARAETRHDAVKERAEEAETRLRETLGRGPLGVPESETELDDLAAELDQLKRDRERLGAVNLRAEDELAEVQGSHDELVAESQDLTEAIRQLRQAIQSLNREGRDRLDTAYTQVNAHFERLFVTLFGGGEAHLSLVESDDPLQAGLEIMARPPGKKSQTLSLLSGGEQTLTALALIFAIFLTNPAPVCVLDEVDAPLDDANVERFCHLLRVMSADTATRFMIVTHNPVTMSHMDRLFGVTMAERGVSQLVSVDLEAAGQLLEAV
jgi:chromosome segregation protein